MPDLGYDEEGVRYTYDMKIAQITLAYSNAEVVQWLIERGTAIKSEKWDRVTKIEGKIVEKLRKDDDGKFLDKLQRPCSAFVTWDSEEALRRAEKYSEEGEITEKFLGQTLEL